ncbi:MAG: hypothetical protein LBD30_07440 [Verrucomicrobiales bacterium]|nr:hypothetical protein [Verrucomicrobiales bacterium]
MSHPARQNDNDSWSNNDSYQVNNSGNLRLSNSGKSNYASIKFAKGAVPAMQATIDQKYEKIGSVALQSEDFDKDEKNIRDLIKQYDALIQYEQSNGLAGAGVEHRRAAGEIRRGVAGGAARRQIDFAAHQQDRQDQ